MKKSADNYIPASMAKHFRSQAFMVWGVAVAVVFAWIFAIVLAPIAVANGWTLLSAPIYGFFGWICHQIPARSFYFDGHPLAVCARCFGIYFGLFASIAAYPLWRQIDDIEPLSRIWLLLSLIPTGLDWSLTFFGIWENTHLSRLLTGLILGGACGTFIVPGLVEIQRNMSARRRTAQNRTFVDL